MKKNKFSKIFKISILAAFLWTAQELSLLANPLPSSLPFPSVRLSSQSILVVPGSDIRYFQWGDFNQDGIIDLSYVDNVGIQLRLGQPLPQPPQCHPMNFLETQVTRDYVKGVWMVGDTTPENKVQNPSLGPLVAQGATLVADPEAPFKVSAVFDGSGAHWMLPNAPDLNFDKDFTMALGFYANETLPGNTTLLTKGYVTSSIGGFVLRLNENGANSLSFHVNENDAFRFQILTPSNRWNQNQWNIITMARMGSNVILYINGVESGRASYAGVFGGNSAELKIGYNNYNGKNSFKGKMSGLMIMKGLALNAQQVQEMSQKWLQCK